MKTLFAEVLLTVPVPNTFTYRIPFELNDHVQPGMRVVVPFGRSKLRTGILVRIHENPPRDYTAKYLDSLLDTVPLVNSTQMKFWDWMATYYMCFRGDVLNAALPSGLKLSSETRYLVNPAFEGDATGLSERELLLLDALGNRDSISEKEIAEILGIKSVYKVIKNLLSAGAILIFEDLKEKYKPKTETFVSLSEKYRSQNELESAFRLLSRAPKQEELLLTYVSLSRALGPNPEEVKKSELLRVSGASSQQLSELERKGILTLEIRETGRLDFAEATIDHLKFQESQEKAYSEIVLSFLEKDVSLLHGVTASGKTEIYIRLIREQLALGKQVLYLLPEIALTTQMISRLQNHFGEQVAVYHSRFNENERVETYQLVLENRSDRGRVILGPRSALFLPFTDLGLVIVDEEHEPSYKQYDPAPRYHGRDSAIMLAHLHGAKTLLGSATPSFESFFNAQAGKYGYISLSERYGGLPLPEIRAVSIQKKDSPVGYFSKELIESISQTLEAREQVILFQNRRGYAPILVCEICGWAPECTRCDITTTYHKSMQRLVCHYCSNRYSPPPACPSCGSHKLKLAGFGTERIEEEIAIQFPAARVGRLDLDSARSKHAYRQIISDFEEGALDILIGTQIVTKGLDFGKVNLVGVINADLLTKFPDFRATERAYQLMTQVAGRAGRRKKRGKVLIQTHDVDSWLVREVISGNYERVYQKEMEERREFRYPPLVRMIRLTFQHSQPEMLDLFSLRFREDVLGFLNENAVLGPEYPPVARIKNKYHKNLVIKIEPGVILGEVKAKLMELILRYSAHKTFRGVRVIPNVDPQ